MYEHIIGCVVKLRPFVRNAFPRDRVAWNQVQTKEFKDWKISSRLGAYVLLACGASATQIAMNGAVSDQAEYISSGARTPFETIANPAASSEIIPAWEEFRCIGIDNLSDQWKAVWHSFKCSDFAYGEPIVDGFIKVAEYEYSALPSSKCVLLRHPEQNFLYLAFRGSDNKSDWLLVSGTQTTPLQSILTAASS